MRSHNSSIKVVKTYSIAQSNRLEDLQEIEKILQEDAEILTLKLVMHYLQTLREVKDKFDIPIFSY